MDNNIRSTVLGIYGLPVSYAGKDYSDTGLAQIKIETLPKTIANAPSTGTLTIQGTAAPVINQLITDGRKVRGVNFVTLSATAFEDHILPVASVVLLHNVGTEVSTNFKISGQVFRKVLKFYADKQTLLVIETDLGKTDLLSRYDFRTTNYIKIPKQQEDIWV